MKLSLYLAAQLTYGVCIIHYQKTTQVLAELQELRLRAGLVFHAHSIDLPQKGKSKARRRKQRSAEPDDFFGGQQVAPPTDFLGDFGTLELPNFLTEPYTQQEMDFLGTQDSLFQARFEDVTLIDDQLMLSNEHSQSFGDELAPPSRFQLELFASTSSASIQQPTTSRRGQPNDGGVRSRRRLLGDQQPPPDETLTTPSKQTPLDEGNVVATARDDLLAFASNVPSRFDADQTIVEQQREQQQDQEQLVTDNATVTNGGEVIQPEEASTTIVQPSEQPGSAARPIRNTSLSLGDGHLDPTLSLIVEPTAAVAESSRIIQEQDQPAATQMTTSRLKKKRLDFKGGGLLIDSTTKLPGTQQRFNMEHGEQTMIGQSSPRIAPKPLTARQLLSKNVERLMANPGHYSTALSSRLLSLWKSRRYQSRDVNYPPLDATSASLDQLVGREPTRRSSIDGSNRSSTRRVRPSQLESLVEEVRGSEGGDRSASFIRHGLSPMRPSGPLDVTFNQASFANTSGEPHSTSGPQLEKDPLATVATDQQQPIDPTVGSVGGAGGATRSYHTNTLTTTQLPVLMEESMMQQDEQQPVADVYHFVNRDVLLSQLTVQSSTNTDNYIKLSEICGPDTTRLNAARTFAATLELLKLRKISVFQSEPYGEINIQVIST